MTTDPTSPPPERAPARHRQAGRPRARARALGGAAVVLGLLAAACGGGGDSSTSQAAPAGQETATAEAVAASEFMSTRPGAGIAAASGNPRIVPGNNPCDSSAGEPVRIAYMGADLASLDDVGLESLIIEEPGLVIEAYVNEVNFHGGIDGRCVEFHSFLWNLGNAAESITEVCVEMPQREVLFSFVLRADSSLLNCITTAAQVPTIGLYASAPTATFEATGGRFYADDGSTEHLLSSSVDIALQAGLLNRNERVGLLHAADETSDVTRIEQVVRSSGLDLASSTISPANSTNLSILLAEKQVRLLEAGLSEAEQREAEMKLSALPPEVAQQFELMETFFLQSAEEFKNSGVTAVVTTADWSDVRRFMRAAELVDWTPTWITNDIQPPTLTLTEAPERQAENLVVVSARRAAGDAIPELDRSCMSLRNTASDAPTFSHRLHTDAWSLLQATCDYLDVTFSAMTRAAQTDGALTRESFMAAMHQTSYDTDYGTLITFDEGNPYGWERFRVLEADPACVLNDWGCMRSATDWLAPAS